MKNLSIILLMTMLCSRLHAQDREDKPLRFGIRAGANYSLMNFNKAFFPPDPPVKNVWKPGFTIGAFLQVRLNDRFTLQPEYAITRMNGEDPRIKTEYRIDYLSLPLFIKYSVFDNFSVFVGPQFDLLVNGWEKSDGTSSSIEHQTEERGISFIAGAELQVYKMFFVDARYLKGLNHVGIQRSDVNEFKWGSWGVGVGVRF